MKGDTRRDWEAVWQALERARLAIEGAGRNDPERQQRLLRERARMLARPAEGDSPGAQIELLAFRIAGERYALETRYLGQVHPMLPITPVPGVPDFVVGIVPAQGEVVSVIDLRLLLKLPLAQLAEPSAIVVLQSPEMEFGILADELLGVSRFDEHALEAVPATLADIERTWLKHIAPQHTAVLDAQRLLADPRLRVDAG